MTKDYFIEITQIKIKDITQEDRYFINIMLKTF